jgi:hypothetical protein
VLRLLFSAVALTLTVAPAETHHAISAYYDNSKRTTIEGTVAQFQFVSPHPFVVLDVAGRDGTQQWRLEMDNRSELVAIGVRIDTLKAGDRVVVTGSLARDRSSGLYVLHLKRPSDGFEYEQVGGSPRLVGKRK